MRHVSPPCLQWAHSGYLIDIAGFDDVEAFLLTGEETGQTEQNEEGYGNPMSRHKDAEPRGAWG